MKQTLLQASIEATQKKLRLGRLLCCLLALMTLGGNLFLALSFTEQTYLAYLIVNIGTDILCGSVILLVVDGYLCKQGRYLRLCRQNGSESTCRVDAVSGLTVRYLDMDCHEVTADGRKLFLPKGTFKLKTGENYRLKTVSNVITEAAQ